MVAFIRKVFVASLGQKDLTSFAMLLGGLLVLGIIYFMMAKVENKDSA
jgi:uncharacterized membrane protein (DUF373 family)